MWDRGATEIDGKPLFTDETEVEWEKFMNLVRGNYFSDPSDFDMHIDVRKTGAKLGVYRTKRGN